MGIGRNGRMVYITVRDGFITGIGKEVRYMERSGLSPGIMHGGGSGLYPHSCYCMSVTAQLPTHLDKS